MFRKSAKTIAHDERIAGWMARRDSMEARVRQHADALIALQRAFHGDVILPGDPSYPKARQLSNDTYQAYPLVIAYCETVGDVRAALAAARRHDWWVTCRAGGHSSAGFSVGSGIVIDVSRLSHVSVDAVSGVVTVGGGTSFQKLNAALDGYGLHVVGGGCDEVCVGGYLQGGGYGFTSLAFGMQSDNCLEVLVMLADGSEVVASATENPDLFWAIRGGTGNNFGVLLEAKLATSPLGTLWGFTLSWPLEKAPHVLVELQQRFMKQPPSALLGFQGMVAQRNQHAQLGIAGLVDGTAAEGRALIAPLVGELGAQVVREATGSYVELNQSLLQGLIPEPAPASAFSELKLSGYVARPLTVADWERLLARYRQTPQSWNVMMLEPYGGRIVSRAPTDSAFMHRDVYMNLCVEAAWIDESLRDVSFKWIDGFRPALAGCVNGHAYQNYPIRDATNFRWMYWGDNFPTLLWVKRKYDPDNVFHFAQSVSPYPDSAGPEVIRSSSPSLFSDTTIAYRRRVATPSAH